MKLNILSSTTQHITAEARERAHATAHEAVLRVEGIEALAGDRQRSLQQELASINPDAIGDYHGQAQVAAAAHAVAIALAAQGELANRLIDPNRITTLQNPQAVDEEA